MRAEARLQAAIEILDEVIRSARDGGAAADVILARAMRARRYAGSRDRAAIRETVFSAIRAFGEPPPSGRAAMVGLALSASPGLQPLFDGGPHAPRPIAPGEPAPRPEAVPGWLAPRLAESLGEDWDAEVEALLGRAPVDLRVNRLKASPEALLARLPVPGGPVEGLPLPLPDALRLSRPAALERHPARLDGWFEVQDAASQFAAAVAAAKPGETVVDLCAGAGGKTLALASAMGGEGRIIACDVDGRRLAALDRRLARAGAAGIVEVRPIAPDDPDRLSDLRGRADLVFVDAPCSGSGTWRRNPELRWRLTPDRLRALVALQARLLDEAETLVRPGGRVVYAVCSVLAEEGPARIRTTLGQEPWRGRAGPADTWLLTPHRHGCDGFFVARVPLR